MIFVKPLSMPRNEFRVAVDRAYRMDEDACVSHLLEQAQLSPEQQQQLSATAQRLVERMHSQHQGMMDRMLYQYDLSSEEGLALLCLTEALLRIPDRYTTDELIRDRLTAADWQVHLQLGDKKSNNALTMALTMASKLLRSKAPFRYVSVPVIRSALTRAIKTISRHFIMGRTIKEAVKNSKSYVKKGFACSYDMLGEAARTADDARQFFTAYYDAIQTMQAAVEKTPHLTPSISVKLSALHPRYEYAQRERILDELVPKVLQLACLAKQVGVNFTIDAEEADRLDLSLEVIEAVFSDPALAGWNGFGLALQAYQKRAWYLIDWIADLAKRQQKRMFVRLVKGAYWDFEIKDSQMRGLSGYPVFTRKESTDVSFQACAKKLLSLQEFIRPAFATHNAYSIAMILALVGGRRDFEFQCLYGMGQYLYEDILAEEQLHCRIYAPVGHYEELLPYLMRRLLENGANTSFLYQIHDKTIPVETLLDDPVARVEQLAEKPHPAISLPTDIFQPHRRNSQGIDLMDYSSLLELSDALAGHREQRWQVGPILAEQPFQWQGVGQDIRSPHNQHDSVGVVHEASAVEVALALQQAAQSRWDAVALEERARCLERAADLLEQHRAELMTLLIREGGKILSDAVSEVREAVDFCRYYAQQARHCAVQKLPGYTGEENTLSMHGRGIMVCISPWNFPLAIFTGQVVACLVTGNAVLAKPAEQTPLIASVVVRLLHAAGITPDALQLLPGLGETVGQQLVVDERIAGVLFTGSTETAKLINRTLAERSGPIIPFIAETGGQNTMVVDSSALLEQAVDDIIESAFLSAGQRCSALRVLYVQEDIADRLLTMLAGAIAELVVDDASLLATDIGPIIDQAAKEQLLQHVDYMQRQGKLVTKASLSAGCEHGLFVAPHVFEIESLAVLKREVFGPMLHVIRYAANDLDRVIDAINHTGYGLTFGIHSRVQETVDYLISKVRAGNCYVNRNMIGAIVGLQPFGGQGLSGTGPKAGGPHYLQHLCHERTLTVNTTAVGGDTNLLSLD